MLSVSCDRAFNEAGYFIAANGTTTIEHKITAFYCAGEIDDADGTTAARAKDVSENLFFNFRGNCCPEFGRFC